MANNTRIGCSAGKTTLVDPNAFYGQDSSSNMFVPLEDLSIYVQLETQRKARTVLTSDGKKNLGASSSDVRIKFIEGSEVGGKKVLTTKFTDLTTSFDTITNEEGLGITGIDIDFNSSYAPLITINFIDVRGTSIFQNESKLKEGKNKYGVFFQLPYPLYTLTIKGYYGMPVSYCLHMTKFTSRFNSQTGNFEITASFIGYTYAMLSDLLIGYLKVIKHTQLGGEKYKSLNPSVLSLNELMVKINDINTAVEKISADDPDAKEFSKVTEKKSNIDTLKTNLYIFGQDVDINKELSEYRFVIVDPAVNKEEKIKKYQEAVKELLALYNADGYKFAIDEYQFTSAVTQPKIINDISLKQLRNGTPIGKTDDKFNEDLLRHINSGQYGFPEEKTFSVYDLRSLYNLLDTRFGEITKDEKELQKKLGETIRAKVAEKIGFDPTVRNLINVFTTAAEVFLSVLYQVSTAAKQNTNRTAQLKKFENSIDQSYDYKKDSNGGNGLSDNYFPWPDYREKSETSGLVEEYLGKPGVLDRPLDVNELEFIDDLLKAFLIGAREDELTQLALEATTTNWFAANPLDTRLMGLDSFPYQRIEGNSYGEIVKLMVIRAMTFFYSNKGLRPEEIQAAASAEIESVLKYCVNEKAVEALGQAVEQTFLDASGMINAQSEKVIQKTTASVDSYYYNYIFGNTGSSITTASSLKLIPINGPFIGNISPNNNKLVELAESGNLFLTNYTTTELLPTTPKPYDGGVYIKMISRDEYSEKAYPTPIPSESAELDLSILKKKRTEFPTDGAGVGFNLLSGSYGVQEFMKLNYGQSDLSGLPYRYMFYENSNYEKEVYNKANGLGLKRSKSKGKDDKPPTSPFDINSTAPAATYRVAEDWLEIMDYIDDDETVGFDLWLSNSERLHTAYGKTRELSAQMLAGSSDICYPFVNFQVKYKEAKDGKNLAPVSLFGSRFYYEQTTNHAKAFLFLHTFPWTGLVTTGEDDDWMNVFASSANNTIFDKPEIYNTFGNRAGFVSAPRLWAAFIGGLLWRADFSDPVYDNAGTLVSGGAGLNDPILFHNGSEAFIPTLSVGSTYPTRWQYLTKSHGPLTTESGRDYPNCPMLFDKDDVLWSGLTHQYKTLDTMLLGLPEQAKDEFKKVFYEFVDTTNGNQSEWSIIKENLEVFTGNGALWVNAYTAATSPSNMFENTNGDMVINYTTMTSLYNDAFKNYKIFTPLFDEPAFKYNYIAEIDDTKSANEMMLRLFDDEIIIANMSWMVWQGNDLSNATALTAPVTTYETDLQIYIRTILSKLAEVKDGLSTSGKKKQREQEIFGTSDENLIKLQLYRTCKNIYDKWIGGVEDENSIIFQCGGRNTIDTKLATKYGNSSPKLIDSFRFVNRSFSDIGDKLVINPIPVNDYLTNNPNSSFYDVVTSLLSANNFDFVPLPTFINYNDPKALGSIFKPMSTIESFASGSVGPSFVCVYVGQKSKHLDTFDSDYPNDGFDFRCNSDGNLMPTAPKDFTNDANDYEDKVAVFAVNYSQQNQNIFKDIVLDQNEFSETAESLQITDEIASKGAENHLTLGGQNMYNVYSVRSYKAEVEMMGNAMIQPMMYFQLNNIPMFHGAYLITHVKHHIKPNHMSTNFTGVRIREPETPLIDVSEIFMSLIDTIGSSSVKGSGDTNVLKTFSKTQVIGSKADYVGFVTYDVPESDSLKFQEHDKGVKAKGDSFAMKECGEFMVELAKKWRAYALSTPGTDCLFVNNFGAYGGGTNKKHGGDGGLHAIGLACDLQPMAKTKIQQRCVVGQPNYDQAANIKFIQMAIDLSKSQDKIKIQNIILNDPTIINHFSGEVGSQGKIVISWAGHDNHIHIEFDKPPRVVNEVKAGKKQDDALITSAPTGSVTQLTGKLPNESERLNALGQI
jgi:hypothetical protein